MRAIWSISYTYADAYAMYRQMFTHAEATAYSAAAAVVLSLTSLDIRHAPKFHVYSCALVAP